MEKVLDYIRSHRDAFVEELFEVLRIPSISAQTEHRGDMVRCAEHLAATLVKAGADHAEVMPTEGNPVVFAEKIVDPKAKTVLVYGHYDVMPVDPREEWTTEPFEPVVRDGRIWGARSRRRQGAVVHAHQGVRGDVRDRTTALQREVHARRRRGDRFAESLQILPRAEETAEIGCHSGLRYVDDFDGYTFDYLRVAWFNLYAG